MSLSEAGRAALERASRILAEGEAVEAEATAQSAAPRGLVRVAAPMTFGIVHLAPLLPEFLKLYPDVSVDLSLDRPHHRSSSAKASIWRCGFRACRIRACSRVGCAVCAFVLVGAPAYFAKLGRPAHPKDLAAHTALLYTYSAQSRCLAFQPS